MLYAINLYKYLRGMAMHGWMLRCASLHGLVVALLSICVVVGVAHDAVPPDLRSVFFLLCHGCYHSLMVMPCFASEKFRPDLAKGMFFLRYVRSG